ncbi:hypothetical protein DAPPUDRAFT_112390 [Daphnia pulex]|uniref:BED-type domain-containing protein n=1 Tax=Daphnia pulex TaxID=6669 RepID=E9HBW6_DAPPU|nr:hypothetical protein DAPPUDRAFT_112390 [Daphnia pulex]|eukprot:EFX70790.1 hypothetical protein DAPPUDRAFT_112390 [Daphnia pulex]
MSETKKGRSPVWDHFKKVGSLGAKKCRCLHCEAILGFCGNTTNMLSHLSNHHQDIYLQVQPKLQKSRPKSAPTPKRPRLLDENGNETEACANEVDVEIHDVGSLSTPMDTDAPTSNERENGSTQASSSSSTSQSSHNFNQVKRKYKQYRNVHIKHGRFFGNWACRTRILWCRFGRKEPARLNILLEAYPDITPGTRLEWNCNIESPANKENSDIECLASGLSHYPHGDAELFKSTAVNELGLYVAECNSNGNTDLEKIDARNVAARQPQQTNHSKVNFLRKLVTYGCKTYAKSLWAGSHFTDDAAELSHPNLHSYNLIRTLRYRISKLEQQLQKLEKLVGSDTISLLKCDKRMSVAIDSLFVGEVEFGEVYVSHVKIDDDELDELLLQLENEKVDECFGEGVDADGGKISNNAAFMQDDEKPDYQPTGSSRKQSY